MIEFLNLPLKVTVTEHGTYVLDAPLVVVAKHKIYIVPRGFETDFASVPKIFRNVIDNDEPGVNIPAVFHDWLCRTRQVSRLDADRLFLESLKAYNVPFLKRWVVYIAVRFYSVLCELS